MMFIDEKEFKKLIEKKDEAAKYMHEEITYIIKNFEKRDPGSKGERQACEYMAETLKNDCGCDKVQIEKRAIIEEFLTAIGVNNANTSKRERLNTDEVNSNNDECYVSTAVWRRNLKETSERARKLFPNLDFSISIKDLSIIDNSPSKADVANTGREDDDTGNDK